MSTHAPIDYALKQTPPTYRCETCKASGVKLWRLWETSYTNLLCTDCAYAEQTWIAGKDLGPLLELTDGRITLSWDRFPNYVDAVIGWRVAAVLHENGDGYWAKYVCPPEAWAWWFALPRHAAGRQ